MKKLFVFAKRAENIKETEKVIDALLAYSCTIFIDISGIENTIYIENPEDKMGEIDFIAVLGGDGSLLGVARKYAKYDKPILGINFGRLGYLVELEKSNLDSLSSLFDGNYRIEERIMIDATVLRNGETVFLGTALNDAVVTKGALSRMVHLSVFTGFQEINQYHADGVVVATPTGSTAYSMSAGGSAVSPELEVFLITPICPHSLTCKPIIVSDRQSVKIKADFADNQEVYLTLDGQEGVRLSKGDIVEITKSVKTTKLIRMTERNFFNILKQKLEQNR